MHVGYRVVLYSMMTVLRHKEHRAGELVLGEKGSLRWFVICAMRDLPSMWPYQVVVPEACLTA